ncbi:hypothetical protein AMEJIAPC_03090 [Caulobacter sp. NIBR1757]|nr:hypothetical protein AMEJIAPC_03090 [Caulobacter sp. NIBR1757]
MMAAAATLISEMFVIAAQRMEEATKDKLPPDSPVQRSTAAMIAQLQAQLNRALGVTPQDGMPGHEPKAKPGGNAEPEP